MPYQYAAQLTKIHSYHDDLGHYSDKHYHTDSHRYTVYQLQLLERSSLRYHCRP